MLAVTYKLSHLEAIRKIDYKAGGLSYYAGSYIHTKPLEAIRKIDYKVGGILYYAGSHIQTKPLEAIRKID